MSTTSFVVLIKRLVLDLYIGYGNLYEWNMINSVNWFAPIANIT